MAFRGSLFSLGKLAVHALHMLLVVKSDLLAFLPSLGPSLTIELLQDHLAQIWIPLHIDGVFRRAKRLPVELLYSLHALKIVLNIGRVLLSHNFDLVRPPFVPFPARSQQENEPFALKGLQVELAQIKRDFRDAFTVVCVCRIVLTVVSCSVALVLHHEDRIDRSILQLFFDLSQRTQLVVEWVGLFGLHRLRDR